MLLIIDAMIALQQDLPRMGADYIAPATSRYEQTFQCNDTTYVVDVRRNGPGNVSLHSIKVNGRNVSGPQFSQLASKVGRYRSMFKFEADCGVQHDNLRIIWRGYLEQGGENEPAEGVLLVARVNEDGSIEVD